MSFHEYCSSVYKSTLTSEKKKKLSRQGSKNTIRRGRKLQLRQRFVDGHPQSQTYLHVIRTESFIPSLSLLPPSEDSSREKFQICMLILFKPFTISLVFIIELVERTLT